jgi:hypothetical protein
VLELPRFTVSSRDHGMVPAVLVDNGDQVLEDGEVGPEELYALVRGGQAATPGSRVVDPQRRLPETFLYSWDRGGGAWSFDGRIP